MTLSNAEKVLGMQLETTTRGVSPKRSYTQEEIEETVKNIRSAKRRSAGQTLGLPGVQETRVECRVAPK